MKSKEGARKEILRVTAKRLELRAIACKNPLAKMLLGGTYQGDGTVWKVCRSSLPLPGNQQL